MLQQLYTKNYNNLNENDLYIWKYISQNRKRCETLSIDDLSKCCNVSKTTILRFCKRLGLKGYSEFKFYLCIDNKHLNTKSKTRDGIKKLYLDYIDQLEKDGFDKLIAAIEDASNIYIYGRSALSKNIVREWQHAFLAINKLLYGITTSGHTDHYVENINANDVVIIISFSGETTETINFVTKLKLKRVKLVALTLNNNNTLLSLADISYTVDTFALNAASDIVYNCVASYFIFLDFLISAFIDKMYPEGELIEDK
ncbi:MurR/RpiR family transcriptional regulator [Candidatus Epulonipiscium viviparus]|uniref:MurR/RpiR family transcriptional regulator n=1 Tax=Candidatus Epulonipiscium viviparus TaxID=420336 RepID=UPI0027380DD6|nr:MurR/RpiR family transcriptional regulator [Candidatus Epulopiscium viviparus]